LYFSVSWNLFYAAFKLIAGIRYSSFWYGADALFYIALSAIRLLILRDLRKEHHDLTNEFRQYRLCGYLLFVLDAAFVAVVYQVVNQNKGYHYPGIMIYAVAVYTYACLVIAVVNVVEYRKLNNPILSAVKAVSLTKVLVAFFALTTAMLIAFGGGDNESQRMIKGFTGGAVCLYVLAMAIYMVNKANRNLQSLEKH